MPSVSVPGSDAAWILAGPSCLGASGAESAQAANSVAAATAVSNRPSGRNAVVFMTGILVEANDSALGSRGVGELRCFGRAQGRRARLDAHEARVPGLGSSRAESGRASGTGVPGGGGR